MCSKSMSDCKFFVFEIFSKLIVRQRVKIIILIKIIIISLILYYPN